MIQYIGARYVPRFSDKNGGVWDNSYSYEALEIVKHGSDFYTSKIPVPTGVAITNTTYWVKTGDYNGAISGLQDDVNELQGDVGTLETDMGNVKTQLEDTPLDMPLRTYLFLTDSYEVTGQFLQYLTNNLHADGYYSKGMSGAGFYNPTVTWYQILTNSSPLTPEQLNKITHIVICPSGLNDTQTNDIDLYNAMSTLNDYFKNNMPNLKDVLVCSIGWSNHSSVAGTHQATVLNNCRLYSQYACFLNWRYVDCTRVMKTGYFFNPTTGDGYHPSTGGGLEIARAIYGAILTGNCQWEINNYEVSYTLNLPSAWSGATIVAPANGHEILKVSVNANGQISIMPNDFIIKVTGINCEADYYDIELTPDVQWRNAIPVGYKKSFMFYKGPGSNPFDWVMLFRYDASHTVIRVYTRETLSSGQIMILPDQCILPV